MDTFYIINHVEDWRHPIDVVGFLIWKFCFLHDKNDGNSE